ncbi:fengycin family lipopeptide synthetase D [Thermoflexales bacterium]|nr:fengycin family lipopeptide synthetase D [Thermoflexales bacterium]
MTTDQFAQRRAKLAARRAALSPEATQQLEHRLQGIQPARTEPAIPRTSRQDALPLSLAQQRLWFLGQLIPDSTAYHIPQAVRLVGAVDIPAFERSLNEIVLRHEVLRTTFTVKGEQPIQVIAPELKLTLPVIDLTTLTPDERETQLHQLMRAEAQRLFQLTTGPLLRVTLVRLAEQEHVLLVIMHHIISDGWSIGVFVREVMAIYIAFCAGQPSPLPELPLQYADYAVWQRQRLSGEMLEQQIAYWKQQFNGELPVLQLPTDHPRPPAQTFRGAKQTFTISGDVVTALQAIAQSAEATLFMTLLGAFQVLLHHYTGQTEIIVGTPIANRAHEEIENLIGFFVNTLALRVNLAHNPSFTDLLKQVREVTLGAYAHQDLPFDRLIDELHVQRDLSHAPLFQVLFVLQNAPMPTIELPGLTLRPLEMDNQAAQFDLTLSLIEVPPGLLGTVEYNTDLFERATIQRLIAHFQTLLARLAHRPQQRLSDLDLLTEVERQQLLQDWNTTQAPYPRERCLHELIEDHATQTPDAVAVTFEDAQLTYRELNEHANQLAHYLQQLGIGPEIAVGVCLARSLELIISLLAIWKAGGTYVPLDPTLPPARLTFTLADARATLLLTDSHVKETLSLPEPPPQIICLDRVWPVIEATSGAVVKRQPGTVQQAAYIIYTSGSTGRPKGVVVTHQGLSNVLTAQIAAWNVTPSDRVLQFASINFDASIAELIAGLGTGATLCLTARERLLPGPDLAQLLRDQSITLVTLIPSALAILPTEDLPALRVLHVAGEACPPELMRRWVQQCRFFNLYGPTENTIWATYAECSTAETRVTIGRPIANTQAYILNAWLRPVPVGVPGELYVSGVGLARGYLQRPEITAERFIPHPFSLEPGARVYRTGDLARYLPDGRIEFLGRLDHQVKVRGFRIELGEIEAVLQQQPAIREAVMMVHQAAERPDDKRLIAYLVPDTPSLNLEDLRRRLLDTLPDYMVPTAFILLEALPLTTNGKVDRRALPSPDLTQTAASHTYVAPRTLFEQELAAIWTDILHLERVGVRDNFFAVGGHSLLATQVVSRLNQTLKVQLPLRSLFEAPTIAELAVRLEALTRTSTPDYPSIAALTRPEQLPLSFSQERLWFIDQWELGNTAYNIPSAVRLQGQLDVPALERSLTEIIRRHESLRTTFVLHDEHPIQVITPATAETLPLFDLSERPAAEREAHARQIIAAEAQRPFDLAHGPLWRTALVQLAQHDHILLITTHHIVSDGWSIGVLVRELTTLYHAFSTAQPSPLPELPIQYADYAIWQRQWLSGDTLTQQLAYWQQQFSGELPTLDLPSDRPRPPVQTFHGATYNFQVPLALTQQLLALGQEAGATLFMTLLAAFQTLLYRYTGQTDLIIGTPIANRTRLEIESLIGFFVNTLALRVNLTGNPTFLQLLAHVREVTLGAYAHQDLPFDRLVDELHVPRELSRTPLFQVIFALQNAPMPAIQLPDLQIQPLETSSATAKFDLTLFMTETADGLLGQFEYNTDLFEAATLQRMAEHLLTLLNGIIQQPDARLLDLSVLTAAERHQLLVEWNAIRTEYPRHQKVHELYEAQVKQTPEAVALVFENEHVTYSVLNQRANQLAHHLQTAGVGSDVLVGISLERSLEMVVGLLGILKAGGAYVPLDPAYPPERLAFMIQDAGVRVLVTHSTLKENLPEQFTMTICLDQEWAAIVRESQENLASDIEAGNLVYVMYTSGSTGTPKGIGVTHRNVVRLVRNTNYADLAEQTFLQFAPISFDASTLEVWGALLNGGRLVVPPAGALSLQELGQIIETHAVTTVWLTAGLFHLMVDEQIQSLKHCRQVLAGGDILSVPHVNRALQVFGTSCRLINGYGPTENTTFTCCYSMKDVGRVEHTVPIGRPITNTTVYILDRHLQPVPIGVPGELYTGGDGLARGYLNRPELTAEKFIPHPFSEEPGARLYKTGDLARYLPDGNIEFLGRNDQQVKLRGFRIELGEIEARLNQHPAIQQAAVIVREQVAGDKRLVAYLVTADNHPASANELRQFLHNTLPDYMIPAVFVSLESLPLTPNGKIDRHTLPVPDEILAVGQESYTAPRTSMEEELVAIWTDVLHLERVGIHDNFFAVGGHSLLATQVVSRLNQTLKVQLPLRGLFEAPTIAELAGHLDALAHTPTPDQPRIVPTSRPEHLPLSFAQERLWFLDQLEPGNPAYNIPSAVHLLGQLDVAALEHSLNEIVRRHEALRTAFALHAEQPIQVITPPTFHTLPRFDLSALPAAEREARAHQIIAEEAQRPFDLAHGPLWRAALLQLEQHDHILLVTMHHIISDGWSNGVLNRELTALYRAFSAGQPSPLPELTIQYADYAAWQRQWLSGETLTQQLTYWQQQFSGDLPLLDLPTDRPRPPVQTFHGATHTFQVPRALTQHLLTLSHEAGATLFMTLLAAFQTLLYRYTGQTDLIVGTPIANRTQLEIEGLIGFFVNTLALRVDLQGNPSFRELLTRVREVTLGAYAHQDLPFDRLVDELHVPRDLSRASLFQVMFVLQNAPMPAIELSDLRLQPLEAESATAKFDLTLFMTETADGLLGQLNYNTDLFEVATIERLVGHYQLLLAGVVAHPEQRLSKLPLLMEAERQQALVMWNATAADYPQGQCVHDLFEEQVERTPDAVAVMFKDKYLTYRELNRRATQLAHHLQKLGVGPDVLVGIYLERSLDMVIGLLGTWKAGGAYVPLDPAYPKDRLAFVLQDTQMGVLLTQDYLLENLPEYAGQMVCLERDGVTLAREDGEHPPGAGPANLAYVIYTSGSTGRPKGIMIQHRSVLNLWSSLNRAIYTHGHDSLQVSLNGSISFDTSVKQLIQLLNGHTLHILPEEIRFDAAAFIALLQNRTLDVLDCTPSQLRLLVDEGLLEKVAGIPLQVLIGGEAIAETLWAKLARSRTMNFYNVYGPTECTVDATLAQVRLSPSQPLLGRPLSNTHIYIVDEYLNLVPTGVPGELCISGAGVARGYWQRPELTAEKFVSDPFSVQAGMRLYQTGDRARYLPTGEIEYLGRLDHQVKLRGFRIELGEIEARLNQHPGIQQSAVILRVEADGDQRLVAYVVPRDLVPSHSDLRHFVHEQLPDYMIPATFVTLTSLPLTPNGKLNRRALPAPDTSAVGQESYVAPRTPLEQELAAIWADLLHLERVGIHDNFFAVGGHSLLATQIMTRVTQRLEVTLPLQTLFQSPTIAAIAEKIELLRWAAQDQAGLIPSDQAAREEGEL